MNKITHFKERYTIKSWAINEAVMGFEIYEIADTHQNGKFLYGCSLYDINGVSETNAFMAGSIRFDGCCNFHFPESQEEKCMIHFCGKSVFNEFNELTNKLYDLAIEYMPDHEGLLEE